jgi:nucleoside-diphosphate-sugar epimerase
VVNVVVTGGAGFLGARLARELLAADALDLDGAACALTGRSIGIAEGGERAGAQAVQHDRPGARGRGGGNGAVCVRDHLRRGRAVGVEHGQRPLAPGPNAGVACRD